MKLIHLSDLHLGKRVNGFSMLEDQKYILEEILKIIKQEKPDGVICAGDLYDKPIPSAEAMQLFDSFLTELADTQIPVFCISGNHDSAERLAFGASLMKNRKVYISPVYAGEVEPIRMQDAFGEVCIYLLPFVKPAMVRHALQEAAEQADAAAITTCQDAEPEVLAASQDAAAIATYQDAVAAALAEMRIDPACRNVLVAHQFVTGASRCESEEITVGGLDRVDASLFDGFDYVALGHIHSPQHVGRENVRYSGTPLKYSFSEVSQEKSVTVVQLEEKGTVSIRTIPLIPLHDMRKIRGSYLEVTAKSFYENTNMEDYLQVTLTDEEDIVDGLAKLRILYPNLMKLEYDNRRTRENQQVEAAEEIEKKSELELFEEFFELQNNQPMGEEQRSFSQKLLQEILEKESAGGKTGI